jgi:hypothetical protein
MTLLFNLAVEGGTICTFHPEASGRLGGESALRNRCLADSAVISNLHSGSR